MICIKCKEDKPETHFTAANLKYSIYRCKVCERIRDAGRRRSYTIHKQCLEKLGNKCQHCGFSDVRALQIDHVNGGGKKEIQSYQKYYHWREYYKNVLADETGKYQVLCANCNWIKRYTNKEGMR